MGSVFRKLGEVPFLQINTATKEAILSFAIWMVGAVIAGIWVQIIVTIVYGSPEPLSSIKDVVRHLHKSAMFGAFGGMLPALFAALIIEDRGKRPTVQFILAMSILVTLAFCGLLFVVAMFATMQTFEVAVK